MNEPLLPPHYPVPLTGAISTEGCCIVHRGSCSALCSLPPIINHSSGEVRQEPWLTGAPQHNTRGAPPGCPNQTGLRPLNHRPFPKRAPAPVSAPPAPESVLGPSFSFARSSRAVPGSLDPLQLTDDPPSPGTGLGETPHSSRR